jgi:hypothetical protein
MAYVDALQCFGVLQCAAAKVWCTALWSDVH